MGERAATWYDVPATTPAVKCRSNECGRTIYFIPSTKTPGAKIPVDCNVDGGLAPTGIEAGKGISHFATCGRPDLFHKERPRARRPKSQREMDVPHRPAQCITCGCTRENPCSINKEELDQVTADDVMQRLGLENAGEIPTIVSCVWLQLVPTPICSAPACKAQRDQLPLRMRVAMRPSPAGVHA